MTFLAPVFLVLGVAAAAAIVLLHLITRDRPPRAPLPTARFVPPKVHRAMTRAMRPADPLLLAARVLVLLLAAAAFARPLWLPERRAVARVVALDRSRAVADAAAARDSALALLGPGDALVLFDSSARVVRGAVADTLGALAIDDTTRARGALSPALLAARRAAASLREGADSIELVLISPLAREEVDAATAAIRATWPGRGRLVRVAARPPEPITRPDVRADPEDPIGAAAALLSGGLSRGRARVVRARPERGDSTHARDGGVLVVWPADVDALGWAERPGRDTVGAVAAGGAVLIAPFARIAAAPEDAGVVARWVDGEPAAIERPLGSGCVREVGIPIDAVGDLGLRRETRALLLALSAPCGGERRFEAVDDSVHAMLAGEGPLLDAHSLIAARASVTPLMPWLLAAALLLALAEPVVRRRRRSGT